MYQAYRSTGAFRDKEWLPFTGETEGDCRRAAAAGGLSDYDNVYLAQIDSECHGLGPVPKNALFMGKF